MQINCSLELSPRGIETRNFNWHMEACYTHRVFSQFKMLNIPARNLNPYHVHWTSQYVALATGAAASDSISLASSCLTIVCSPPSSPSIHIVRLSAFSSPVNAVTKGGYTTFGQDVTFIIEKRAVTYHNAHPTSGTRQARKLSLYQWWPSRMWTHPHLLRRPHEH